MSLLGGMVESLELETAVTPRIALGSDGTAEDGQGVTAGSIAARILRPVVTVRVAGGAAVRVAPYGSPPPWAPFAFAAALAATVAGAFFVGHRRGRRGKA